MSRSQHGAPRRPATKLPHLQKKLQKQALAGRTNKAVDGRVAPPAPRTRKDA